MGAMGAMGSSDPRQAQIFRIAVSQVMIRSISPSLSSSGEKGGMVPAPTTLVRIWSLIAASGSGLLLSAGPTPASPWGWQELQLRMKTTSPARAFADSGMGPAIGSERRALAHAAHPS